MEWLRSSTDNYVTFLLAFFGLDRAQRSIVFLSFWTCWSRRDHFSHFVRRHWHIDDSSGSYLVLPLKLAIMLNWVHLDVLDIVLNLFCFWIVITVVVIIQWSSICLALSRYLLTEQWRVTVLVLDIHLKKHLNIVIKVEWLRSPTDFFVMFLLVFFFLLDRAQRSIVFLIVIRIVIIIIII